MSNHLARTDLEETPSTALGTPLPRPDLDPVQVYLAGRGCDRSRETMFESLKRVSSLLKGGGVETIVWAEFTFAHAQAVRSALLATKNELGEAKFSPATINITLAGLRGVLETAMNMGIIPFETFYRAKNGLKSVKGSRLPPGRDLSDEEIARLRAYCGEIQGVYGAMLRGILAVLLGGGLRREEVCKLRVNNFHRPFIDVIGKGNKERRVPLSEDAILDLEAWIKVRESLEIPLECLFVRAMRDGRVCRRPFSPDGLYNLVCDLGESAGLGEMSTHDFRRTCATRQLDRGVDVMIVQRNLGHNSSKTTEKYDRRTEREAKRAVDRAGVY
jgi:integrase